MELGKVDAFLKLCQRKVLLKSRKKASGGKMSQQRITVAFFVSTNGEKVAIQRNKELSWFGRIGCVKNITKVTF